MKNFIKNRKGFTLVELVVVIAILGILAGLAIPRFMDASETARGARIIADMRTIESAESMHYATKGTFVDMATLVSDGNLAVAPIPPQGNYKIAESGVTGNNTTTKYTVTVTAAANDTPANVTIKLGDNDLKALLTKK